ncbi:MAG: 3-oxo-tetronate 4-phosphate decarboxylase [Rhodospirillales bacterium]|jgi:ribulose-5-phosphate 4-epimerase/fuculose-1-phosphate aldolase
MSNESTLREEICAVGKSIFDRGLTFGSSGNISTRIDNGWLMTPTGSRIGNLDPARLSKLDNDGNHVCGDKPTKEAFLHIAMYRERTKTGAVIHLHSTHSVAVSCLAEIDPQNPLPPITAYYAMRIGKLALIPYYPPGDIKLADAIAKAAPRHHAILLANHGPVVAGGSLYAAADAIEELEETAKLFLMLRGQKTKFLTPEQVANLKSRFPT